MADKTITREDMQEGARQAVLDALDSYMQEVTGEGTARGWRDGDLPDLFLAVDAHINRVADRFALPDSKEAGSAFLKITNQDS